MSSLVELVFSAIGVKESAAATAEVTARLRELEAAQKRAFSSGSASDMAAAQKALSDYRDRVSSTATAHRSLSSTIESGSLAIRNTLMPQLSGVTQQLVGMAAAVIGVHAAYQGFKGAIGDGSDLEHLSWRTGENVRNLVLEQTAFENAGLGASYLGTAINLLDRALSPNAVNAKRNATVFRELGVSMDALRNADFYSKIQILSDAFAKLPNQAERAEVAMQLFGRYSGGQMLQLFSDPEALKLAEEQAGRLGARLQQDAGAFQDVSANLNVVNKRLKEMWVAAAEEVLPTLESIAKVIGAMNLSGAGTFLGVVGPTALGGAAAIGAINLADSALYRLLSNMREGTARAIVRGASNGMSDVAAWTPIALAAAVATQIIAGVAQARASQEWHDVLNDIAEAKALKAQTEGQIGGAADQIDTSNTAGQIRTKIDELNKQLSTLDSEMARAPIGVKQTDFLAGSGPAVVSQIMTLAKEAGGVEYTGSNGTSRDYTRDRSERLKLVQEIATLNAELAKVATPESSAATLAANAKAAAEAALAPLIAQTPQLQKRYRELTLKGETPIQELADLGDTKRSLQRDLANVPEGYSDKATKALILDLQIKLKEATVQEAEAAAKVREQFKQIADDEQRRRQYALQTKLEVAQAAGNDEEAAKLKKQIALNQAIYEQHGADLTLTNERIDAEDKITLQLIAQKDAREQVQQERVTLENALNGIRQNLANLESDYTRTEAEKWGDRRQSILQEIQMLQQQITSDQQAAAAARRSGEPTAAAVYEEQAAQKGNSLRQAQGELGHLGANPYNLFDQLRKSLKDLKDEWGTTQQQIAHGITGVINTGLQSSTQHITAMLRGTESLGQGFLAIGQDIEEGVISTLVEMGVRYIATKIMMATADKTIAMANTAALVPLALMQSALWAGPATLATIASFGGAAAAAPFEIEGAMALTQAMSLIPGHETGGLLRGGKQLGTFNENGEEFLFSAPAVRAIGADRLAAQHAAAVRGPSSGGNGDYSGMVDAINSKVLRTEPQSHHFYIDYSVFKRAVQSDMYAIAHQVSIANIQRNS